MKLVLYFLSFISCLCILFQGWSASKEVVRSDRIDVGHQNSNLTEIEIF
jgi:hypothetical protein